MQNVKISTRLIFLSALLIIGALALGLTGWAALHKVNATAVSTLQESAEAEQAVDMARKAQVDFKIQIQEWKNLLLRGRNQEAFEKYKGEFVKKGMETHKGLDELKVVFGKLSLDAAVIEAAEKELTQLNENYLEALKQYDAASADPAKTVDALVKGMDREPTERIDKIVDYVNESSARLRASNEDTLQSEAKAVASTMLAAIVLLTLIASVLTYWIIGSVIRPLHHAIEIAQTVASGDLTAQIDVVSKDETGQLLHALKDMNENLVRIVTQVRNGTDAIATGTSQIASGNLDLSSRTEEQAGALEETASSMEEITSTVKQNADNAKQANQFAANASDVAHQGREVVSQVVTTMDAINGASKKIVDIIGVIDGIAFQTNILALNAAVEAARAGEQGRG
ncbi:MAG TPA: methyl-accepting chemotaxis protein, partial [Oxalicibacterium sp.]|nr:methyl-accepting chemotaxis protein [Oxalicibacterium sp.]